MKKENIQARFIEEHKFRTNLLVSQLQSCHLYKLIGFRMLVMISKM